MLPESDQPEAMVKWLRNQGQRTRNKYFDIVANEFENLVRRHSELEKAQAEVEHDSIQG